MMIKKLNAYLLNKKGMSLVEVLTAMTILTLVIFCFAPLMLSYLNQINASGEKLTKVYRETSKLEVLLSGDTTTTGYTVSLDTIPMYLDSPESTITVNGAATTVGAETYSSDVVAHGLSSIGGNKLNNGISTFYTDDFGSSSGIQIFPSSLTDDFKVAYITIYGDGINFNDLSKCTCVATNSAGGDIGLTKGTTGDYNITYHPDSKDGQKNLLLLTVYGGGKNITFETSPLVFIYDNQRYEIQVDAPMMIMVGEQAPDDNYYYYVSRGELEDTNGDEEGGNALLIHRRTMETESDPKSGSKITLTSAMNDVEWVSETDADSYAVDSDGETYGYYIMGGDNGQVRRFWKNDTTGNYYWGGDYTYYTDINLDRVTNDNADSTYQYYNATKTYSTGTSYKFFVKRKIESTENVNGYKLVTHSGNKLSCLNMFTVNAINSNARFYGSDGKVFSYKVDSYEKTATINSRGKLYPNNGVVSYTDMVGVQSAGAWQNDSNQASLNGVTVKDLNRIMRYNDTNEDYAWLKLDTNAYYDAMGINTSDKAGYPITITSVGAIVINGYSDSLADEADEPTITTTASNEGLLGSVGGILGGNNYTVNTSNYAKNPLYVNHDASVYGDGKATTNVDYPQETYMLYCGYIPGAMDIWQNTTLADENWSPGFMTEANGDAGNMVPWNEDWSPLSLTTYNLTRWDSTMATSETERNPLWKANLGIIPYLTDTTVSDNEQADVSGNGATVSKYGQAAFWGWNGSKWVVVRTDYRMAYGSYYPYTNVKYAVTGKYYDITTPEGTLGTLSNIKLMRNLAYNDAVITSTDNVNVASTAQTYQTNGKVVDITFSYLSHPMALHIAANPSDDTSYDMSNDKTAAKVLYWNNRRETTTILDAASAWVPSGEDDIPVSLAVGYTMGGLAYFSGTDKADAYVNTVMNNGIVFIRAGEAIIGKQEHGNSKTSEYLAKDNNGYKLEEESNYFHQFYYLNSKLESSTEPKAESHIGDLWGAKGWQNNRHINFVSMDGGEPADKAGSNDTFSDTSYNYLRCHPLSNTKVTCVVWGTSWSSNPVAMWGTENGSLFSWECEKVDDDGDGLTASSDGTQSNHNDKSVVAEFQSYKWIDNVSGRSFNVKADGTWNLTVGAQGETFHAGNTSSNFIGFYDACSAAAAKQYPSLNVVENVGFISTLENVNDVEYSDDIWVACGDQSDADPADYCGTGNFAIGNASAGTDFVTRPYISSDNYQKTTDSKDYGRGGSWINVNYWIDCAATGKQAGDNRLYQWSAVQISTEENCNIVQVNCVNGMWIATGYKDANNNDEYDDGEQARIFWTYDPRVPCGVDGGWSSLVRMYDGTVLVDEDNGKTDKLTTMGGINSCATRD